MLCGLCRYSTDRQRPVFIEDQLRKCWEYAGHHEWKVVEDCIHREESVSGFGSDRPAFVNLIRVVMSSLAPFDLILVDDTSRLSRSFADGLQTIDKLRVAVIRVVAVS